MNIYRMQNFSFKKDGWTAKVEDPTLPIPERFETENIKVVAVADGDMLQDCNLSQIEPDTPVGGGLKNIRIVNCNGCNCLFPKDWIVTETPRVHQSFCSHENPDLIKHGLKECPKLCEHVESYIPAIEVDGQLVKEEVIVRRSRNLKKSVRVSDKALLDLDPVGLVTKVTLEKEIVEYEDKVVS